MVKTYVEEVIKCMMERLTKEYGLTEQQALKEIDMCMEKLYVKWMQNVTTQVHVPMDVEIMQVPPTDKEVEKIKSVLEEETGYKFVSLDSITWDVDYEI